MAHKIGDRIKEQANTSGIGAFTLAGALAGFDAFASALTADGDTTWYCAVNDTQWEIGLGTRTAAGVLARTTVLNSGNADALVNFTAPPVVFCTVPASKISTNEGGPAFAAKQSGPQAIPGNAMTKILFESEDFDTAGCFANSRFTPNVAGYYQINAEICFVGAAIVELGFYKNGALHKSGTSGNAYATVGTTLVPMNGTTDYLEVYGYTSIGQNTHSNVGNYTFFQGVFVRPL